MIFGQEKIHEMYKKLKKKMLVQLEQILELFYSFSKFQYPGISDLVIETFEAVYLFSFGG
jgi:hypothetical protein